MTLNFIFSFRLSIYLLQMLISTQLGSIYVRNNQILPKFPSNHNLKITLAYVILRSLHIG
uniref:Uncharacterized protein n=1 Tax=Octopus bimaculoides TaxID=37653 RepID=A0A0L8GLN2_OCTBM